MAPGVVPMAVKHQRAGAPEPPPSPMAWIRGSGGGSGSSAAAASPLPHPITPSCSGCGGNGRPELDCSQQRLSQELVTKDLHGTEWRFRHIYRGQPRRHLLTRWSAFVNKKKLVSRDVVLFLRGDDGELRFGVRRAAQLGSAFPALYNQCSNLGSLANVAHSIATKNVFRIYYNPRLSQSELIIPYSKFMKSFIQPFSAGLRFKMRYESDDATERSYTGIIAGISDADPMKAKSLARRLVKDHTVRASSVYLFALPMQAFVCSRDPDYTGIGEGANGRIY